MSRAFSGIRLALLIVAAGAVLALPRAALADADPASDVLLIQNVYTPYDTSLSPISRGR